MLAEGAPAARVQSAGSGCPRTRVFHHRRPQLPRGLGRAVLLRPAGRVHRHNRDLEQPRAQQVGAHVGERLEVEAPLAGVAPLKALEVGGGAADRREARRDDGQAAARCGVLKQRQRQLGEIARRQRLRGEGWDYGGASLLGLHERVRSPHASGMQGSMHAVAVPCGCFPLPCPPRE